MNISTMHSIEQFLSLMKNLNIKLWVEGNDLRFKAPKGALTQDLRQELKRRKLELIQFIRENKASESNFSIVPVLRNRALPLSFAQERLWFLSQLEPENPLYTIAVVLYLRGALDIKALEKSLNEIVRRHETLRTNFIAVNGKPVQIIKPALNIPLSIIDLRELSESNQSDEIQRLASEEIRNPFDLAKDPLMQVTLLPLSGSISKDTHGQYIMMLTMHHIVSDAWSMGIVVKELSVLYEAYIHQKPSPLPELVIQYADFAVWQRKWLSGETLQSQIRYWKKQLASIPRAIELPTDRPHSSVQSFRGKNEQFEIGADLMKSLRKLSQGAGATLFMLLLSAFAVLLCRYTGQKDILIGSTIANRNRKEIEPLIGFFVNTLVMRIDLSGNPSFLEVIARVRQITIDGYAHQDLPFQKLVEELQPQREPGHSPLFQVMLDYQNMENNISELPGLTITRLDVEKTTAKFELVLIFEERARQLNGKLEYRTDLFDTSTIKRMIEHYCVLLEKIIDNPRQQIFDIPFGDAPYACEPNHFPEKTGDPEQFNFV